VELHDLHLLRMQAPVLRGRVVVTRAGRRNQLDLVAHGLLLPQTRSPRARSSFTTSSMPRLSIRRKPLRDTRSVTKRRSLSSQNRCECRFGRNRRRVLLFAWETLLPTIG